MAVGQDILAGASAGAPILGAPTIPAPVAASPASANPLAGDTSVLPLTEPAAAPVALDQPAPGSFAAKLAAAADSAGISRNTGTEIMSNAGKLGIPPGPGGWAKSLVAGAQSALSGEGSFLGGLGDAEAGSAAKGGPLAAVAATLAARRERLAQQQNAQRDFQLKQQTEKRADSVAQAQIDEAHANVAKANAESVASYATTYHLGHEVMDSQVKSDTAQENAMLNGEIPSIVVQKGVTGDNLNQLMKEGKLNGYEYTPLATGVRQVGKDANGEPIDQYVYDVLTVPKTVTLSQSEADRLHTLGPDYESFTAGYNMPGDQAIAALQRADNIRIAAAARDKAFADADLDAAKLTQEQSNADFIKSGDWNRFLAQYKGNLVQAATHMVQDPTMAKKYGGSLFTDVMGQFATKADPSGTTAFEDIRAKQEDEAEKNRKDNPGGIAGDSTKTGPAYLASLPAPERSLVQQIITGQVPIDRWSYIIARQPTLVEEATQADPDFDGSKVQSYIKAYQDFTSGKTSQQIKNGATALQHLNELYDLDTVLSHAGVQPHIYTLGMSGGGKDYQAYQDKVNTLVDELAAFYGTNTDEGRKGLRDTLEASVNRRAAITTQAQSLGDRLDNMEQEWKNAAPSPTYEAPLPNISDAAIAARARLDPRYAARLAALPKVGAVVTQGGQNFVVDAVDANGRVTAAHPAPPAGAQ